MKMAEQSIDKSSIVHPAAKDLDKIELFRTFKKYDRNMNGTLDFAEYTQCLTECPDIDLSKSEIITVAMAADLNGDGVVDGVDLALLLGAWGTDEPELDLVIDGVIDGADLAVLLGAWTS